MLTLLVVVSGLLLLLWLAGSSELLLPSLLLPLLLGVGVNDDGSGREIGKREARVPQGREGWPRCQAQP